MANITLRRAVMADAEMVFEWRNAPETRRFFFNTEPLQKSSHMTWFEKSLTDPNRCLLIAELEHESIGVVRYDMEQDRAEIDVYVKPGLAGKGLGTEILKAGTRWIQDNMSHIKVLVAKVIAENIASCRAFEKAGFVQKVRVYERNL